MCRPLVSVIVPIYKVEPYLRRAVDSLVRQTYNKLEIILIDDGSPDKCPAICDEYASMDNRIKVIHKSNGGLSDARNYGLNAASGNFLTFLDSDDYLSQDAIETMMTHMLTSGADIVCCSTNIIDNENNVYDYMRCEKNFTESGTQIAKRLFEDKFPHNYAWGKLYKSCLFDNITYPTGRIYEDIATTYIIMSRAHNVLCLNNCLYYYEINRNDNITSEVYSNKAAWSYYCGCINSKEMLLFCRKNKDFSDAVNVVERSLFKWSKLCIENAIKTGRNEYENYCKKVSHILKDVAIKIPFRLRMIMRFRYIYYYLYPIIGRHR